MPISYGSISEFAIGELGLTGADIDVPVAAIAVSASAPQIAISANLEVPPVAVAVLPRAPDALAGALTDVPVAPAVLLLPAAPEALSGTVVDPPVGAAVAVVAPVPQIVAGTIVDPPTAVVQVIGLSPQILQSSNLLIPVSEIIVAAPAPAVGGGAIVDVDTEIGFTTHGGAISEGAISEFAIGEGPPAYVPKRGTVKIDLQKFPPEILAGKIQDVPVSAIQLNKPAPEIVSRTRKMRVQAIAS